MASHLKLASIAALAAVTTLFGAGSAFAYDIVQPGSVAAAQSISLVTTKTAPALGYLQSSYRRDLHVEAYASAPAAPAIMVAQRTSVGYAPVEAAPDTLSEGHGGGYLAFSGQGRLPSSNDVQH